MSDVQIADRKERWRLTCKRGCRWHECDCLDRCRCGHPKGAHATDELGWPENCDEPGCGCQQFTTDDDK